MSHTRRFLAVVTSLLTVALAVALGSPLPALSADAPPPAAFGPETGTAVEYELSPPARDLAGLDVGAPGAFNPPRVNPLAHEPDGGQRGTWNRPSVPADPLIDPSAAPDVHTPALNLSFEGTGSLVGCGACAPPDTNGDVGPNHYIQMVNATKVAIFDKSGNSLAAPFNLGSLWSSGTCASNAGDPVVLYDPLADRWLLSQFAGPNHMCFAISQTPDPTGSYHLFTFNVGSFPDYFKIGVWPDAYYMGANEATYTAYAFNRAKMLAGDVTANFVKFSGQTNFLLPADLDGPTAPPPGSPGLFYTFKDNAFHGGADRIEVFALAADFTTPASSTFTMPASLPIASFTYTVCGFFNLNCARQLGTLQRLDVVSEWPMHRFPYRNFGTHQTLVGNFTVGVATGDVGAAIRWFELRNTGGGWTLFQQGTHAPGDGHDRFMGSIAMDGAGNIALGYSVSSNTLNPAIRYATRAPGDPAGTLQAEAVLINGAGSQTSSNRWGDYSAMSVDPADDCTFWYTNEYYPVNSTSQWHTRVGAFRFPSCGATNTAPTVSAIADQVTSRNTPIGPIPFTVDDLDTPVNSLTVSASSSNQALVPNANVVLGGSGANRTVTLTPAPWFTGTTTITITASDGLLTGVETFVLTVTRPGPIFADVPDSYFAVNFVERLFAVGVTSGCATAPLRYCPDAPVTREQMAAFIIRALGEFTPPPPSMQRFLDVPPSNPFYAFIDRMAALGITGGCGGGRYCPGDPVTRGQMAVFLIRAFNL